MINLKLTVISAILGLFFSLLVGLISKVTFGYLLLRAVISAVLTGGIAAAASFVFKKFLADDAVSMAVTQNTSSTGNVVDITLKVDEDVLPDAENAPQFYVSPEVLRVQKPVDVYRTAAKQKEGFTDSAISEKASESGSGKANGFVPQPLISENTPQYSVVPDMGSVKDIPFPEQIQNGSTESSGDSDSLNGLDELPDLSNVVTDSSDTVSDVISDSDFATADNPSANYSAGSGNKKVDVGNDASLMADTIRTLLKSEG